MGLNHCEWERGVIVPSNVDQHDNHVEYKFILIINGYRYGNGLVGGLFNTFTIAVSKDDNSVEIVQSGMLEHGMPDQTDLITMLRVNKVCDYPVLFPPESVVNAVIGEGFVRSGDESATVTTQMSSSRFELNKPTLRNMKRELRHIEFDTLHLTMYNV